MHVRRLPFTSPESPVHNGLPHDRHLSDSPTDTDKKLLAAMTELSEQMTSFAADMTRQLTSVNTKLLSMDERIDAMETKVNYDFNMEELKRKRRVHNPKIAVRIWRQESLSHMHCSPEIVRTLPGGAVCKHKCQN